MEISTMESALSCKIIYTNYSKWKNISQESIGYKKGRQKSPCNLDLELNNKLAQYDINNEDNILNI